MKVTFKNVGQGDSIIIEWAHKSSSKIGIIDCSRFEQNVPIIIDLKSKGYKEIEFIVLSHPHKDHYSGMFELLDYIEQNNIKVKRFIHSMFNVESYLEWAEIDPEDTSELERIIEKAIYLTDTLKLINRIEYATLDFSIPLTNDLVFYCLSPSDNDIRAYTKMVDYFKDESLSNCSNAANLLSTFFVIKNSDNNELVLLTSDLTQKAFENILEIQDCIVLEGSVSLFQIPHHGSLNSHSPNFWKSLNYKYTCNSAISAGINRKFNHPDYYVVEYFDNEGFVVNATNYVNGYKKYFDNIGLSSFRAMCALDDDSEEIMINSISKDLVYAI